MRILSKIASAVVDLIVRLRGPVEPDPEDLMEWRQEQLERWAIIGRISMLNTEISRLRRNKKRHSHLIAERDALMREAGR